ncbi:MAG TPA: tripartite tricarboxylate transporter substrate-binding protein [Alphaproteobacteria bacterium]|nr:tripartite tricarboxylate transporter substrate-binding protein [Alphaproteobacteria bacterium]
MPYRTRASALPAFAFAACLIVFGVGAAAAQDAATFYKGKQFKFISTSGPGGGYDAYSRLLSRHIADHIPGNPSLVFENMPGASGMRGTNYMYNIAPKDGTVMAGTYNTLLTDPLLGDTAAKYDPTKFEWIGSITTQYNSCMVWAVSPIKTIEDAMKQEVKVSTTGMTGNSALTPAMLNKLIGTKFKLIAGYTTTGMRLAVEQGEVDGICGFSYDTYEAANRDWIQNKRIRFILQTGTVPNKAIPDVPLLKNYVKNPQDIDALKILGVNEDVGRPHMFPPGVPEYLVTALRRAFDATMKDPKFLADAHRMHIDPEPMTGEAIQAEMIAAYKAPKEAIARAAELWPPPVPGKK